MMATVWIATPHGLSISLSFLMRKEMILSETELLTIRNRTDMSLATDSGMIFLKMEAGCRTT